MLVSIAIVNLNLLIENAKHLEGVHIKGITVDECCAFHGKQEDQVENKLLTGYLIRKRTSRHKLHNIDKRATCASYC